MRNKRMFLTLIIAFCLGLLSQHLIAQSKNLARLYIVEVKTGQGDDFAAALKKHVEWRKQQGDPWTWIVHQVVNGKNLGDFLIRSGGHSWSDFDDYTEFIQKSAPEFNKAVGPYIKDISSLITAGDTVNVDWPENPMDINLISITTYHVKPGHEWAFTQAVSKYHKAIQDNNRDVHYAFAWNVNGSKGPIVNRALPYKNWSAIEGPDESFNDFLQRVLGKEESMKLYMEFSDTFTSTESMMLLVRPDLSLIHSN